MENPKTRSPHPV